MKRGEVRRRVRKHLGTRHEKRIAAASHIWRAPLRFRAMALDYPFSVFWKALRTTVGWITLIMGTIMAGTWLGWFMVALFG